jgi:surface antigen
MREITIRNAPVLADRTASAPVSAKLSAKDKLSRTTASLTKRYKKRFVRYGLLAGNIALVALAIFFVVRQPSSGSHVQSAQGDDIEVSNPLDTVSSADIAVNIARTVNLLEATSVKNQAESVAADLNTSTVKDAVVPKPQILSSVFKTKADIQKYTVVAGDTLGSLASKFGVTSDSIKWSNNLSSSTLKAGTVLTIPPVDGIVYVVKAGDTADSLATKFSTNKDQITAFNDAEVTGLKLNDTIVVPGGSIAAAPATAYYGFAFGTSALYGNNGYDYGWCTWYAANRRAALGNPVPSNLGNAYSWYTIAQRAGLPTGSAPQVSAVAVNQGGNHVSVVEQVNGDGSFWVSEMNASGQVSITDSTFTGGWGRIDYKLYTSVGNLKFIY